MQGRGEVERLRIEAFKRPNFSDPAGTFVAFVNPTELTVSFDVEYDSAQGAGTTGSRMDFKKVKPGGLAISFFLDGTGANGRRVDVVKKVEEFQRTTGYSGDIHRTHYLKVAWGNMAIRRCVLKSASVTYKLFKPSGVPLRAVIAANFTDSTDDDTRLALAQDQSPDLTHLRRIKAGDTLPGLCYQVYGDPRLYLEVARHNDLLDFRNLQAGTALVFPPLER